MRILDIFLGSALVAPLLELLIIKSFVMQLDKNSFIVINSNATFKNTIPKNVGIFVKMSFLLSFTCEKFTHKCLYCGLILIKPTFILFLACLNDDLLKNVLKRYKKSFCKILISHVITNNFNYFKLHMKIMHNVNKYNTGNAKCAYLSVNLVFKNILFKFIYVFLAETHYYYRHFILCIFHLFYFIFFQFRENVSIFHFFYPSVSLPRIFPE